MLTEKYFIMLFLFLSCFVTTRVTSQTKLTISSNGRYIQWENGKPFFWLGDTGWLLFKKLNREEAKRYLEDRSEKGFNVIQAMVIHSFPATNVYGDSAFINNNPALPKVTNGNNPNNLVEYDYWDHIEFIIDYANTKGIFIALVPVWGSNVKSKIVNENNATTYAEWLTKMFRDKKNIIWINGGDTKGDENFAVWNSIGNTIKKIDPNHLITFHPFGRMQSSKWFHNESWLDFNMFQSGHKSYDQDPDGFGEDNWKYVVDDYIKTPIKPTLDGEPSYEGIPQGLHDPKLPRWQSADLRRYAYWSVFAGACGFTYGNNSVMQMLKPGEETSAYGATKYWFDAINDTGASQMIYLKNLILSLDQSEIIPYHEIVKNSSGEKYNYLAAVRTSKQILVYTYNGRNLQLNFENEKGKEVNYFWFNPRDGSTSFLDRIKLSETMEFDPPGKMKNGNDWVLIVELLNQ